MERLREGVTAAVRDYRDSLNLAMDRSIEPLVAPAEITGLHDLRGYLKSLNYVVKISVAPSPLLHRAAEFLPRTISSLPNQLIQTEPPIETAAVHRRFKDRELDFTPDPKPGQGRLFY